MRAKTSLNATRANCLARGVVTTDGLRCLDEAFAVQPSAVEISRSFSFQPAAGCRPWRLAMVLAVVWRRGVFGRRERAVGRRSSQARPADITADVRAVLRCCCAVDWVWAQTHESPGPGGLGLL
jgi:hypothetical protein